MRRWMALAAAALVAGCSVGVEGAPCQSDANCPDDQACEYAGRCSKAARGCGGAICRQDVCAPGEARACVPDGGRVCASLVTSALCAGTEACGVVSGRAQCFSAAITAPAPSTKVGKTGVVVDATLTFPASGFLSPASVELRSGTTPVATLLRQSVGGLVASYSGHYTPADGIESNVALVAVAGSAAAVQSPSLTLDVDTRPPSIQSASATCTPSPCYRDDVLTVTATAVDGSPTTVEVTLDLEPTSQTVTLTGGPSRSAQLALRAWQFQALTRDVVATIRATDDRNNSSTRPVTITGVTRLRPAHDTGTLGAVTSPAIDNAGTAIFGTATTSSQLRAILPDGTPAWGSPTTLAVPSNAGMSVLAAPSIGEVDVFVASEDGRMYRVLPTGAVPLSTPRYPTSTNFGTVPPAPLFTPVIFTSAVNVDHAHAAGGWATLFQFYSDETTGTLALQVPAPPPAVSAVHAAGAVAGGSPYFAVSSTGGTTLRRFNDVAGAPTAGGAVELTDGAASPVPCDRVEVPLAVDEQPGTTPSNVIAACRNGQIHRVSTGTTLQDQLIFTLPTGAAPSGSPVVLADGGILVSATDGKVRKLLPGSGTLAFSYSLPAGEYATGVAAANEAVTATGTALYLTTNQGRVVALDAMGNVHWSGQVVSGALAFPAIAPAPSGSPNSLPTLYAGSSAGKLVRVVVDSGLDTAAPWPKAHHDLRNTGNKGAALP